MRKLIASTLGVGAALAPAALAAEPGIEIDPHPLTGTTSDLLAAGGVAGFSPLPQAALQRDAAEQLRAARERAERKRAARRKRARERAAKRRAAAGGAPAAAPAAAGGPTPATPGHLAAIAACESGGNPSAIGGGGAYRGKYQFSYSTWASVGGSGDPAAAPEAEQDRRAAMLYAQQGSSPWPVCGG